MKTNTVIILGSARNDGNTRRLVDELALKTGWDIINLNDYTISQYDYANINTDDDYMPLITKIIAAYDVFVFATPVYWYAMSGVMKTFFDRFTDLITINKELGRQLRLKKMAVISSSVGDNLGDNFWLPFTATANYLGMYYIGNVHTIANFDNDELIGRFVGSINNS
ncbi:FMN reductase [Flavobacterium sp. Sd200]|uniref:flavodoxin family protein n=1 Tax=Flavobacterium sp. Sd200 TaxID=2692211 RepID=UPI00136ECDA9|nr:NAD(P)H-dependent oxidoreductase [Flavobacterium sp. Sd200]MXN92800.1 FMN reductase [Flavobacterium sp. Sd200]